jgi:hypothetical protein
MAQHGTQPTHEGIDPLVQTGAGREAEVLNSGGLKIGEAVLTTATLLLVDGMGRRGAQTR